MLYLFQQKKVYESVKGLLQQYSQAMAGTESDHRAYRTKMGQWKYIQLLNCKNLQYSTWLLTRNWSLIDLAADTRLGNWDVYTIGTAELSLLPSLIGYNA